MKSCAKKQAVKVSELQWVALLVVACCAARGLSAAELAGDSEFFEKRIRPLLVERCYECHSDRTGKAKGGLRLDTREGLMKGGDSGPAISVAQPQQSMLLRAIRHEERELKMPPKLKDRLSKEQSNDFESWIRSGAEFPVKHENLTGRTWRQIADSHWAFQPLQATLAPKVKDATWPRSGIDRYILAKLEENNLRPSPPADPRALIRRATFDLHGLPPTPEEVEDFVKECEAENRNSELLVPGADSKSGKPDSSNTSARDTTLEKRAVPDAHSRLIDRLLASPRYGERWGRHWLDLARYSDTKGYVYGDREERFFVHAHAYRDWVIRAFNEDLPYDRFLVLQIAADQLLPDKNVESLPPRHSMKSASESDLAAIGFLTIGRRFLGVTHDIIDDRIDTLTRTTLGLTVSCARCHDHKFDPIPTDDYYSLYGVFMNTTERTLPLTTTPPDTEAYRGFEKELRSREAKLRDSFAGKRREWSDRVRTMSEDYLLALLAADKLWTEEFYAFVQPNEVNPPFVRQWQSYLHRRNQAGFDAIFEPWHRLYQLPKQSFTENAAPILAGLLNAKEPALNGRVASALGAVKIASMEDLARMYGKLLVSTDEAWRELRKKDGSAAALVDHADEALRMVLYASDSPVQVPDRSFYEAEFFFDEGTRVHLAKLASQIDQWLIQSPGATPHAVILEDLPSSSMRTARVFRRGNPAMPGKEVDRQFLELLSGKDRKPFAHDAGRLDLAQAIIDPKNPLTARVMVNRIWQHHFSSGLVSTPSDFGTRSALPTHPELLDHLATQFIREGWSIKQMHRSIMTSAVYRQSSEIRDQSSQLRRDTVPPVAQKEVETRDFSLIDPTNKLLSHFSRRRLDFESMRDAMLMVSGELNGAMGGRPIDLFKQPFTTRRSVYGLIDRQFFPGELRIFDVASPDLHSPTRPVTTIPQQALFFMNSAFIKERAKALVERVEREVAKSENSNPKSDTAVPLAISRLYLHLYQRKPSAGELALGIRFIESMRSQEPELAPTPAPKPSAWVYGYGELDENAGRVKTFEKLPHFSGQAWQGGSAWPDGKLGWVQLTAEGGHAGNDLKHAAIRRWIAPRDMAVSITSTIQHERQPGDGIRAFVVHGPVAKVGEVKPGDAADSALGSWTLHNQNVEANIASLKVRQGDTIDFIVDIRGNLNNDDFIWKVLIAQADIAAGATKDANRPQSTWASHAEFTGVVSPPPKPLSAWEMYAQALMLSNEFMFVD